MDKRNGKRYKFDREEKGGNKSLNELFDIFYYAKVAEGRSGRTLEMYRESYSAFCEFLDSQGLERALYNASTDTLRSYMNWMLHSKRKWDGHPHKSKKEMTIGLSPVTANTKFKSLRTMFKFLFDEGHITTDPAARVRKASEPQKEIRIMSVSDMKKLLSAPDKRTYAGFRDFVIMNVLIESYARINEVLSLKQPDIDFSLGIAHFDEKIVKTRKGRHVPLQQRTLRLITELLRECEEFDSEYLFLTNYGGQLSDDQFRTRLKEHAENAGLKIRIHPHLFRHTAATLFLENGGDLRHLAKLLGHADLRQVMKYTHLSDKSIRAQHNAYSPINDVIGKLGQERKVKRKK